MRAARYAPDGERGACPVVRATGYWPGDWNAYAQKANREVFLLPLIEDRQGIDEIEMIAAQDIEPSYERMLKSDVKYRFVIDAATM